MNLLVIREEFYNDTTIGRLFVDGEYFCHTLEDAVRGFGIKVNGETAIPAGQYKVKLSQSHRFKRLMPMVYTEDNGYELKSGGISFKGVRIHGGNDHTNTEGCILVAHNRVGKKKLYLTAESDLTKLLKKSLKSGFILTIKNR